MPSLLQWYGLGAAFATLATAVPNPANNNQLDTYGDIVLPGDVVSIAGGGPVTLNASDIQQLLYTANITNPTPSLSLPQATLATPTPTTTTSIIKYHVPETKITLYLKLHPQKPIERFSMGQILLHALRDLRLDLRKGDGWIPFNEWTYIEQPYDCLVTASANSKPGTGGRKQHITWGMMNSAVLGLWQTMYTGSRFCGCDFEIEVEELGVVGVGSMVAWSERGVGGGGVFS